MAESVNYKMLGNSGLSRYGGYVYEEFLPQLRWPRAAKVYQEMSDNDPTVGSILYLAEMLIRQVGWSVEAASDSTADKEAAEFLESCMDDMDMSWDDVITEIISMLAYGFSFHEIVYKIRRGPNENKGKYRSKYTDGKIGWRRIPGRSQSSLYQWDFDEEGDIKAFMQMAPPTFEVISIPLSKGLLFRTKVTRDNPEGKSLLRNAYRPWYFKKRIEEIEGIGVERDLAGLPVLQAPENIDLWNEEDQRMQMLRTNATALVQGIRRDSEEGVLLPHGWDLSLLSTGSSRTFDTNAIINRYDNRIAITMLSDLILIGSDKTGSFALADTKQSLLATALEAQLGNIANVFNKYAVPNLFKLNRFTGITEHPRIVPGHVSSPALKEIALLLRSMGLNIAGDKDLLNYLRKISEIPQMDDETFEKVYLPQSNGKQTQTLGQDGKPVDPATDPTLETDPNFNDDDTVDNDLEQNDLAYTGQ